ncbi:MAG: serine/threonine-protein kinase [Acidobacteriota bacterium]
MNQGSINKRYQVLEVLGRSGMSIIFKVWDSSFRRVVALKASNSCGKSYSEEVIAQEYLLLSMCRDDRIVRVLSFDIAAQGSALSPGTLFFTMEYLKGVTMNMRKEPSFAKIKTILLQVLSALNVVHSNGIVYGDVKPHNIMVIENGDGEIDIKLFDFGLAMKEGSQMNGRDVSGTLAYMAPEMFRNARIDRRADLYSLGALLYEMITGYTPFPAKDALSLAYGHLLENPINPASLNSSIPEKYKKLIVRLLQKDPDRRFQSVEEILFFLKSHEGTLCEAERFQIFERILKDEKGRKRKLFKEL